MSFCVTSSKSSPLEKFQWLIRLIGNGGGAVTHRYGQGGRVERSWGAMYAI